MKLMTSVCTVAAFSTAVLLSGCGAMPGTQPAPAPAPAQTAQPGGGATTSGGGGNTGGGDTAGKPSLDEVKEGTKKVFLDVLGDQAVSGTTEQGLEKMADCIAENVYDSMSVPSLQRLARGEMPMDQADLQKFSEAAADEKCLGLDSLPTGMPSSR